MMGNPDATNAPIVTVPLTACPLGDYAASFSIGGTNNFSLVVDTGSTTLGVASSTCTSCDGVMPVYSPGSTATDEHQTASSQFVTGGWSGEIYQDSVGIDPTTSVEDNLVAIHSQSQFFQTVQCGDGVVGFAPRGSALTGTTGLFDQLVATRGFADVFSLELCPSSGKLWLGGFDSSVMTAAPQYVPIANSPYAAYYYVVGLTSIGVLGQTIPLATTAYENAIVDTGTNAFVISSAAYGPLTSLIAASPAFVSAFGADAGASFFAPQPTNVDAGVVAGAGCFATSETRQELDSTLPALTLTFGSKPGISIQATATQSYLAEGPPGSWCPVIASVETGTSFPFDAIVGTPVLLSSVVVFDRTNGQLGFAPHAPCP
jgi:cathepsin D